MRATLMIMLCLLLATGVAYAEDKDTSAAQREGETRSELNTQRDKLSYSIGYNMGTGLKRDGIDVDPDILGRAFKDAYTGGKSLMTEQEMKDVIVAVQRDMAAKQQEKRKQLAEKNKREGEAFLAENRKKEGVKVLPSGLQYKVLAEGTGKPPKASDKVTVNYRGTLIDGTEFDSSYKHGSPATFALNQVIKGWTEGLQLIKPAGKIQLFVPPDLGYGERGMGQQIGPNATLVFEVELIAVQPATE